MIVGVGAVGKRAEQCRAVAEGRHLEAVIAELAARRLAVVVVVFDERSSRICLVPRRD